MRTKDNTQNRVFYQKRKGQSAIEYLMTYGWMLLVVAIVGGAIFATVSGQCLNDVSGFTGSNVVIDDYAADTNNNEVELIVQNGAAETVEVQSIQMNRSGSLIAEWDPSSSQDVTVGSESSVTLTSGGDMTTDLSSVSDVDACNDYNLEVTYSRQGFSANESASGTLQGNLDMS